MGQTFNPWAGSDQDSCYPALEQKHLGRAASHWLCAALCNCTANGTDASDKILFKALYFQIRKRRVNFRLFLHAFIFRKAMFQTFRKMNSNNEHSLCLHFKVPVSSFCLSESISHFFSLPLLVIVIIAGYHLIFCNFVCYLCTILSS